MLAKKMMALVAAATKNPACTLSMAKPSRSHSGETGKNWQYGCGNGSPKCGMR
jgi:hypothetical protein